MMTPPPAAAFEKKISGLWGFELIEPHYSFLDIKHILAHWSLIVVPIRVLHYILLIIRVERRATHRHGCIQYHG